MSEVKKSEPGWAGRISADAAELAEKMQWQKQADSPTMRRYTDFSKIDFGKYETAVMEREGAKKADENFHLVFSDFRVARGNAELPKGVIVEDLATAFEKHPELVEKHFSKAAPASEHKGAAIHYSRLGCGAFVHVQENVRLEEPIRVRNSLSLSGRYFGFHTIVVGERGSKFTYFEEQSSSKELDAHREARLHETASKMQDSRERIGHESREGCDSYASSVCEVFAHEGAMIDFCSMQKHSDSLKEFAMKRARIGRGATMNWLWGSFGAGMSVNDSSSTMWGEGGASNNFGIFYNSGKQHSDISANVSHVAPNATSEIFSRGVVTDSASSVYRGLIRIGGKAVNTASGLEEKTLLLGEHASANALPSLEIDTNDVTAKHAAAVGKLDSEQLFYLAARGIPYQEARGLMVRGFLEPVLARIPQSVRPSFESEVTRAIARL